MYIKNNKYVADAGKYLASGLTIGYELPTDMENVVEHDVTLYDMEIREGGSIKVAVCTNEKVSFLVSNNGEPFDYATLKTHVIKMRYSNDDQIAIILNKDEDTEHAKDFQRMQEWREYASAVAHKIMELVEN